MLKKNRICLRILGVLLMVLSIVLFGFVETKIPPLGYFLTWILSLKMVDYSTKTMAKE